MVTKLASQFVVALNLWEAELSMVPRIQGGRELSLKFLSAASLYRQGNVPTALNADRRTKHPP
jgi:hypothetical protein